MQNLSFVIDRVLVMMAAVLLLIPSVFGAVGTYINYEILTYLPPELDSMAGEQYLENGRRTREAVRIAVEQCSQSILISGLNFFVATASVAVISKMELLKSSCLLISREALISMAVILLVLPALLIVFAPLVQRTTWCWPKQKKGVKHH